MNLRTLVLGCCALLLAGCSSDPQAEDFSDSVFFLDNQTEYPLLVEWKSRESPDAQPTRSEPVPSRGRREFASESNSAVSAPSPSATFLSVSLIREDTGARVYVQEPIRDDAWRREVLQVRLGELRTQYILSVRNEDLTP
jgi:hypothetical protein